MAEIFLSVKTDASQTTTTIGELEGNVKKLKTELKGVAIGSTEFKKMNSELNTMKSTLKNATAGISEVGVGGMKSIRAMRLEVKDLMTQMDAAAAAGNTGLFKQLETQLGILKNDVKDANARMKMLDPGEILGGWVKVTQGIVGSFAAVTGALSLFGVENENIQAIEKKSMALIQMMIGLEQARMLLIDGGAKAEKKALLSATGAWLGKTLGIKSTTTATAQNTVATVAQTSATGAQTVATGGATVATKLFGAAMKALPIFAIIGGVIALVSALSSLAGQSARAKQLQEEHNRAVEASRQAYNEYLDILKKIDDAYNQDVIDYKVQSGEMTQADADRLKAKDEHFKNIRELSGNHFTRDQQETIAYNTQIEKLAQDNEETLMAIQLKYQNNYSSSQQAVATQKLKYEKEKENATKQHLDNLAKSQKDFDDAATKSRKDYFVVIKSIDKTEQDKIAEDNKRRWEQYLADLKSVNQKIENYSLELIENEEEREQAKLELERKRDIEEINSKKISAKQKSDAIEKINLIYAQRSTAITDKYIKNEKEKDKELYSYKVNLIEQNKKESDKYYDELLKAGNLDEEQTKEILDRKRQANYDYYNSLIKLAEQQADEDGIRTSDEIAYIEQLTKNRNEFVEVVEDTNKKIEKTDEETIQKRINLLRGEIDNLQKLFSAENFGFIDESITNVFQTAFTNISDGLEVFVDDSKTAIDKIAAGFTALANTMQSVFQAIDANIKATQETQIQAAEDEYNAAEEHFQSLLDSNLTTQEEYDAQIEAAERIKEEKAKKAKQTAWQQEHKLAIVNATLQGIMATLNAYSSGMAYPLIGPATAAIFAGIAAAFSAVQIGLIAKQKMPAFAGGGLVEGEGTGTSDSINARLSNGEFVINAASTKQFLPLLRAINYSTSVPNIETSAPVYNADNSTQPIRAYVVEGDISETSERVSRMRRRAELS